VLILEKHGEITINLLVDIKQQSIYSLMRIFLYYCDNLLSFPVAGS